MLIKNVSWYFQDKVKTNENNDKISFTGIIRIFVFNTWICKKKPAAINAKCSLMLTV